MKTYLTYGLAIAVAMALLTLALYFLGLHEAAKIQTAQMIALPAVFAICITGLVLGIKARRADVPATEPFGYGRALGAGFMISLFAALFGMVTSALYFGVINPDFCTVLADAELAKAEARGVSGQALEGMEKGIRFMMRPSIMTIFGFFQALFGGTVFSLIIAAFLKRDASEEPPPVAS